ncbi:MAG: hypothetical protein Ct9H90mP8_2850 [Pseudomonadota bacterium]|nr:MAG: hypothetical protein Ct9H90mP8_2850 [Pseudomonadota bacterium]
MRALEVVISAATYFQFSDNDNSNPKKYPFFRNDLRPSETRTLCRINRKTLEMMDQGWIDEVRKLKAQNPENLNL